MRKNACCFTGHREIPPEDREPLRAALLSEIQRLYAEKGVTEFYTGGARGFDTMAKLCPCGCTSFCRAKGKATAGILRKSAATVKF